MYPELRSCCGTARLGIHRGSWAQHGSDIVKSKLDLNRTIGERPVINFSDFLTGLACMRGSFLAVCLTLQTATCSCSFLLFHSTAFCHPTQQSSCQRPSEIAASLQNKPRLGPSFAIAPPPTWPLLLHPLYIPFGTILSSRHLLPGLSWWQFIWAILYHCCLCLQQFTRDPSSYYQPSSDYNIGRIEFGGGLQQSRPSTQSTQARPSCLNLATWHLTHLPLLVRVVLTLTSMKTLLTLV